MLKKIVPDPPFTQGDFTSSCFQTSNLFLWRMCR